MSVPDYPPPNPALVCPGCGGPAVTHEDGFVMCDDCVRLQAKKGQMDRERAPGIDGDGAG